METKHTPGPWIESKIGNPYEQYLVYSENDGHNVAHSIEGLANARLIAAAPDMLEALRRAETHNSCSMLIDSCKNGTCWHEQVRAAIAKAEGNGDNF